MILEISCECGKSIHVPHWRSGQKGKCTSCQRIFIIPSLYDLGYEIITEPLKMESTVKNKEKNIFVSLYAISLYTMILGLFAGNFCKTLYIERLSRSPIVIPEKKVRPKPQEVAVKPQEEKKEKPKETIPDLAIEIFPGGWYSSILQALERLDKNFYGKKYRVEEGNNEIVIQGIHNIMKFASFIKEYRQEARQLHSALREIENKGKFLLEWISMKLENKTITTKPLQTLKEFAISGNISVSKEILKTIEDGSYILQHEIESGIVRMETIRQMQRSLLQLHEEFTTQKNTIQQLRKEWSE